MALAMAAGEALERGTHRTGIGVVAFIGKPNCCALDDERGHRSATFERREPRERSSGIQDVAAKCSHYEKSADRVYGVGTAGRAHMERNRPAEDGGGDLHSLGRVFHALEA